MSVEEQEELLAANRSRYCAPYDPNILSGIFTKAGVQFDLETPKVL
jgi:hypothetical protein